MEINGGTLKSIMQYLCLLNTTVLFILTIVHSNQKKMGTFSIFSENSTKFAKYFENLAKFSISQN